MSGRTAAAPTLRVDENYYVVAKDLDAPPKPQRPFHAETQRKQRERS